MVDIIFILLGICFVPILAIPRGLDESSSKEADRLLTEEGQKQLLPELGPNREYDLAVFLTRVSKSRKAAW